MFLEKFFRPKKEKNTFYKYEFIRKKRLSNIKSLKKERLNLRNKPLLTKKFFAFFLIAFVTLSFASLLFFSPFFKIKIIEIKSNSSEVHFLEKELKEKNIFLLNELKYIEQKKQENKYIEKLSILPKLPNILVIKIELSLPSFVSIHPDKYCIFDQSFELSFCETLSSFTLSDDEKDVLTGIFNPDSKLLSDFYKSQIIDENEKKEFDWKKIELEKKKSVFYQIAKILEEKNVEHEILITRNIDQLYPNIKRFYFRDFNTNLESISKKLTYSDTLINKLGIKVEKSFWRGDFLYINYESKVLIFTLRESIENNITDFISISNLSDFKSFNEINFSGNGFVAR